MANIDSIDLTEAVLAKADLTGSYFGAVRLRGANLAGARLYGAFFRGTDLSHANLMDARLHATTFVNVDLRHCKGLQSCEFGSSPCVLDHSTLSRSGPLPLSFLRGCGLPEAYIAQIPMLFWDQAAHRSNCFISYSHKDMEFARRLHSALEWHAVRCWRDEKQLLPGQEIADEIYTAVRSSCQRILLCCSKDSLTSWWVDNEIGMALELERELMKEFGKKVNILIPLDLDGYIFSDEWKSGFRSQMLRRVIPDFQDWHLDDGKFDQQLQKVLMALDPLL